MAKNKVEINTQIKTRIFKEYNFIVNGVEIPEEEIKFMLTIENSFRYRWYDGECKCMDLGWVSQSYAHEIGASLTASGKKILKLIKKELEKQNIELEFEE